MPSEEQIKGPKNPPVLKKFYGRILNTRYVRVDELLKKSDGRAGVTLPVSLEPTKRFRPTRRSFQTQFLKVMMVEMEVDGQKKVIDYIPIPPGLTQGCYVNPKNTHLAPYIVICTTHLPEPEAFSGTWYLVDNPSTAGEVQMVMAYDKENSQIKATSRRGAKNVSITASDPTALTARTTDDLAERMRQRAARFRAQAVEQEVDEPDLIFGRSGTHMKMTFGIPPELDESITRSVDKIILESFGKFSRISIDNFRFDNQSLVRRYSGSDPFNTKYKNYAVNVVTKFLPSTAVKPVKNFIKRISDNIIPLGVAAAVGAALSAIKGNIPKIPKSRTTVDVLGARFNLEVGDRQDSDIRTRGPFS